MSELDVNAFLAHLDAKAARGAYAATAVTCARLIRTTLARAEQAEIERDDARAGLIELLDHCRGPDTMGRGRTNGERRMLQRLEAVARGSA